MSFRWRKGRASFSLGPRGPRVNYRVGYLIPAAFVLLVVVAACSGSGTPTSLEPDATTSPEQLAAEVLCSGSTFTRCVEDVVLASTEDPGGLAAICEYGDVEGDVVLLNSKDEAEAQCATNSDPQSKVFKVITIPGTPPPSEAPTPEPLPMKVTSQTQAVARGGTAKVVIKTAAKADCSIEVLYDSGPSDAAGLKDKTADGAGKVQWSWLVGQNTAKGTYPISLICSKGDRSGTLDLTFRVK